MASSRARRSVSCPSDLAHTGLMSDRFGKVQRHRECRRAREHPHSRSGGARRGLPYRCVLYFFMSSLALAPLSHASACSLAGMKACIPLNKLVSFAYLLFLYAATGSLQCVSFSSSPLFPFQGEPSDIGFAHLFLTSDEAK
jgi:hypothetical protein